MYTHILFQDNLTRQMALSQVNRITIEKKYKEMIRQMRVPIMREQLSVSKTLNFPKLSQFKN